MSGAQTQGKYKSAPRDATRMLSPLDQAPAEKEMATPVLQKQRVPGGSMWADGTPEDPPTHTPRRAPAGGEERVMAAGGSRALITGPRRLAHLAGPGSRAGVAPARGGPAPCTSRRQPQTHLPSQPRHRSLSVKPAELCRVEGPGRLRPASSPSDGQSGEGYAADGAWSRGRCEMGGARRARGGARGAGALTTLPRAGSGPDLGAAE